MPNENILTVLHRTLCAVPRTLLLDNFETLWDLNLKGLPFLDLLQKVADAGPVSVDNYNARSSATGWHKVDSFYILPSLLPGSAKELFLHAS